MSKIGCLGFISILVLIGAIAQAKENPGFLLLVLGVITIAILSAVYQRRAKKKQSLQNLLSIAEQLEKLADDLGEISFPGFSNEKGEKALYKLPSVALTEFRSTGSSYQGGSQGISVPLFKGVRYNVGETRGKLTKNPEERVVIDQGSVVFTSLRIVFVGANINREWDFKKLIDVNIGDNGIFVNLAVSNREKISGLQAVDSGTLTPGLLVAVAAAANEKGIESARDVAREYAKQMRALVSSEKYN